MRALSISPVVAGMTIGCRLISPVSFSRAHRWCLSSQSAYLCVLFRFLTLTSKAHNQKICDPHRVLRPQVRTYLLLRSILWQLAAIAEGLNPDGDDEETSRATAASTSARTGAGSKHSPVATSADQPGPWGPRDLLVAGLCTLRLLRANMYHLHAAGVSPGTVGLGTSSGPGSSLGASRREGGGRGVGSAEQRSPFASGLLSLLLDYAGGVLDVVSLTGDDDDDEEEDGGSEMTALRRAVRYEAAEVVGQSLDIFLPEAARKVGLLSALLRLASEGGSSADDLGFEDESKDDEEEAESKARDGRRSSNVAAAAAMADGPLPVDMDAEGCAALLSGICSAICADPNLLLSMVPEAVRPALTSRDVPSYVSAKVRSAEKAQSLALTRILKEGSAPSATSTPPAGGGGGETASSSALPRLGIPRGRGPGGGEDNARIGLWRSGPMAGFPRAGDVVVRGPDWAWGGQDGSAGGRGLVVSSATWGRAVRTGDGGSRGGGKRVFGREGAGGGHSDGSCGKRADRNAVRVMWEKGAINVYRWGALDPPDAAEKPRYDLKVLRTPMWAQDNPARAEESGESGASDGAGGKGGGGGGAQTQAHGGGKGQAGRGELKWSVEEVESALLRDKAGGRGGGNGGSGGGNDEAPTAREVLRFIKNNAPQEWREPRRITGAENALVKVMGSISCSADCTTCFIFGGHGAQSSVHPRLMSDPVSCLASPLSHEYLFV